MNAIAEVRTQLSSMAPEIVKVLPDHVTVEKFERVTLTALQRTPDLLSCDRKSLFESVMACAQDGLIPDGREAALVKFGNRVSYMPMIAGILKKVRQSGELSTITAQVVYEADQFRYWIDDQGEHLEHHPEVVGDPGQAKAVYAMARTTDGGVYIEVLRMTDVNKIKGASRGANSGPWVQWPDQMAKKSAIRRLAKRLPMSTDLESVISRDDQFYPYQDAPKQSTKAVEALTVSRADIVDPDTGEVTEINTVEIEETQATSEIF
jgi:recombination protein RecT